MKKRGLRVAAAGMATVLTVSSSGLQVLAADTEGTENRISSPILVTEVVPNTDNLASLDAYEYFEVTNISNQNVDLANYDIVYINGSKRTKWTPNGCVIPADSSILVWIKNAGNTDSTKSEFCSYYAEKGYGTISEEQVVELASDGLSNSGTRALTVTTKTGKILTTAEYKASDSQNGKLDVDEAVSFIYEGDTATAVYDQKPTPLTVGETDITGTYTVPEVVEKPTVTATEISMLSQGESLDIEVTGTNLGMEQIVSGKIVIDGDKQYPLTYDENGKLVGSIPSAELDGKTSFQYQVSIFDGTNTAVTVEKNVLMEGAIDKTKAPALTITEIMPDSSNVGGADAYEFIEIYNNSDSTVNLKDYRLYYVYPDTGVQTLWWETDDKELAVGETLVFWIKNGPNDSLTREDFNKKFGTELTDEQLIQISNGGMANGSRRGLRLCTNVGDVVGSVIYNDGGVKNTTADKSITYQSQYTDGTFQTVMTSDKAAPTPGKVTDSEKPICQASIQTPSAGPVLTDQTAESFNNETSSLNFSLEAVSSESSVKTVALYLKYNNQENFERYNLTRSGENGFVKSLNNIDLLNKKSYTYYFEVSDGFSVVKTEEKTILNTDASVATNLNLKDGDMITDKQQVIAYGDQLSIDGTDITDQTTKSLNGCGKIAFEATDTDVFFKNAVAVDGDVIGIFNEGTYDSVATYVYDIDASKFDINTKTITVEFHAGNKANVLEHNIENNDDFTLRNIRMVLPNGRTLLPVSYQGKKGLGVVEHDNMDEVAKVNVTVASQESDISMGDGTSKIEILYATFQLEDSDFEAIRYLWDTTQVADGEHTISNGNEQVTVKVDNTAPEIISNIEEGKEYHSGTIEVEAKDAISQNVTTVVLLDGKTISVPYDFRALEMTAGEHVIQISARDEVGNSSEKEIRFTTPKESADIDEEVSPENGTTVTQNPVLSVKATDESNDEMTVTFKKGERYVLGDANITTSSGVSDQNGSIEDVFEANTGNGFPYDSFQIALDENVDENTVISVKWTGTSNNQKTFMYVYNTVSDEWEKVDAVQTTEQTTDGETMTLTGEVALKDHLSNGNVNVIVQNGEGYTPPQYDNTSQVAAFSMNETPDNVATSNENDTPRSEYDFTFAVESDTQYYNEDYDGNSDQIVDGVYQHQLNIHNWLLGNRQRMNIQYLFHDGDIIDDEPNTKEWQQADEAYQKLDNALFPYGVLAGNHDVGHLNGDYGNFAQYFGESRYAGNAWYGGSYQNNRGHYDLITVGGIDFIMVYMGWGIGDEEIAWMNEVLAQYPERKAILNFHEYLLASGGLGEEPQRIHDEVVAVNENVCMVLSGHYHNAKTTIDTFTNADGTTRNVYNMLFDYQGLIEGGAGYMRLMHFDLSGERIIIRTFTPSYGGSDYSNYGDYDAKPSTNPNTGNEFCIEGANLNDAESFEIPFSALGITPEVKTLETNNLDVNVYNSEVIGSVTNVASGTPASYEWTSAAEGVNGWYAEVTDENGGLSRTNVYYVNVQRDTEKPVLTVPEETTLKVGDTFDEMEGVSAIDNVDGDITESIIITGKVNTSIADTYELLYEVTDAAGNKASVSRFVKVEEEKTIQKPETNDSDKKGTDASGSNKTDGTSDERTNTVKTGDQANVTIPVLTMLMSLILGFGMIFKRRKERNPVD